jgi:hypothetical protein
LAGQPPVIVTFEEPIQQPTNVATQYCNNAPLNRGTRFNNTIVFEPWTSSIDGALGRGHWSDTRWT